MRDLCDGRGCMRLGGEWRGEEVVRGFGGELESSSPLFIEWRGLSSIIQKDKTS